MHTIQKNLSKTSVDTLDDATLLETAVDAWNVVCKENADHFHLVSVHHQKQWVDFRDTQTTTLKRIVSQFYINETLTEQERSETLTLLNHISKATHKAREVLEEELPQKSPDEERQERIQNETPVERQKRMEEHERKRGWLGKLTGALFGGSNTR